MKRTFTIATISVVITLAILLPLVGLMPASASQYLLPSPADIRPIVLRNMPHPNPALLTYSIWRTAPFEVAKVFGRSPGCADADGELIEETAKAAIDTNLDPAILAATIATESGCNPFTVSSKGAIGIMQIMPKVWLSKYDFAGSVNLFNRIDNLRVGAQIEAGLINQWGLAGGLRHYNGMGTASDSFDTNYTAKIMGLAGRRP